MKKTALFALAAGALVACQQDNKNLERKIDQLNANLEKLLKGGGVGAGAGGPAAAARGAQPRPPEADPSKTYAFSVEGDWFEGPKDAKITIIEGYDYACPFCERVRGTLAQIQQKYGSDVRVVKKQLVVHSNNAMAGALAFCAAAKQGKAKEMDEALWEKGFKKNRDLDESATKDGTMCWDTPDGCPKVVSYATELQLDVNQFKADMKGECMTLVKNDGAHMRQFGIGGTPALVINGRFIPGGAVPITSITPIIDEELKKANERIQAGTPQAEYYQQWVMDKGLKSLKDG